VKNPFQNLPFKFNLQRYNSGFMLWKNISRQSLDFTSAVVESAYSLVVGRCTLESS
jgi:hypothetical protein